MSQSQDTHALREAVSNCQKNIAQLNHGLARAQEEHARALQALEAAVVRTILPELPPETLGEIFAWVVAEDGIVHRSHALWTLAHVSRSWRSAVITTPSLWSQISIQSPKSRESSQKHADVEFCNTVLPLSKDMPLQFRFRVDAPWPEEETFSLIFSALLDHIHRWKSIELLLDSEERYLLIPLPDLPLPSEVPVLEAVDFRFTSWNNIDRLALWTANLVCIAHPSLKVLKWKLPAHELYDSILARDVSFGSLVSFTITNGPEGDGANDGNRVGEDENLSLAQLFNILRRMTSLRFFSFYICQPDRNVPDPEQLEHKALETLVVRYGPNSPGATEFLKRVNFPALKHLEFLAYRPDDHEPGDFASPEEFVATKELLRRSGCRLSSLTVNHSMLVRPRTLEEIIKQSDLRALHLNATRFDDSEMDPPLVLLRNSLMALEELSLPVGLSNAEDTQALSDFLRERSKGTSTMKILRVSFYIADRPFLPRNTIIGPPQRILTLFDRMRAEGTHVSHTVQLDYEDEDEDYQFSESDNEL